MGTLNLSDAAEVIGVKRDSDDLRDRAAEVLAYLEQLSSVPAPIEVIKQGATRASEIEAGRALGSRAFLTVLSFPDDMEGVWHLTGENFDEGESLLALARDGATEWTVPRWADENDVAFFYYSRRALKNVRKARRSFTDAGELSADAEQFFRTAESEAELYGGHVVSYEFVRGRAFLGRDTDASAHWRTPYYAPLGDGETFEHPLRLLDYRGELPVPHGGTIVPLQPGEFRSLIQRLQEAGNELSEELLRVVPVTETNLDSDVDTWRSVGCATETRFLTEGALRGSVIDHLLNEIRDARSQVHREVECQAAGGVRGRVDYVMMLGRKLVPVEAKLNVLTERDVTAQVRKYVGASSVSAQVGGRTVTLRGAMSEYCLVIDQAGIYVVGQRGFVGCSAEVPLIERPTLALLSRAQIRNALLEAIR